MLSQIILGDMSDYIQVIDAPGPMTMTLAMHQSRLSDADISTACRTQQTCLKTKDIATI
jgi:hypothetical protein